MKEEFRHLNFHQLKIGIAISQVINQIPENIGFVESSEEQAIKYIVLIEDVRYPLIRFVPGDQSRIAKRLD